MSPEQLRGQTVDGRSDVFSLGVMMYEMVSGRAPFEGATSSDLMVAILSKEPPPLADTTPPQLQQVISRALTKDPQQRYTAAELRDELRRISRQISQEAARPTESRSTAAVSRPSRSARLAAIIAALAVIAFVVWYATDRFRTERARADLDRVEKLAADRRYFEAFDLAAAIAPKLRGDERLGQLIARVSDALTVTSDPTGARVSLQRFDPPKESPRVFIGTTPLRAYRLARGDYIVHVEKDGYAPMTRPVSAGPVFVAMMEWPRPSPVVDVKLLKRSDVPPDMVFVPGGEYSMAGGYRPSDRKVRLDDFFIDRYEVSNHDFAQFVHAGGYRRRDLWKRPFVNDGRALSFEEAVANFRDTTGMNAPRGWASQEPPAGREKHPVSGITWYEAAAYAEWRGKKLPTVYQWEKAARQPGGTSYGTTLPWGVAPVGTDVTLRANFASRDSMPVDSMPFGISPAGAYHMAGNVSEWCRNAKDPGFAVRGGGWDDQIYAFGYTGSFPGFYSSPKLGFRCVKELQPTRDDQGSFALSSAVEVPHYQPVSDDAFAKLRAQYDYPAGPLNPRTIAVNDTEEWSCETVSYLGADAKAVTAYLFLPKNYPRPLQVIHYVPPSDVSNGINPLLRSLQLRTRPFLRAGRAVFGVVLEGYLERKHPANFVEPDSRSPEYADYIISQITDLRRGLDYLETRHDIDSKKIGLVAPSAGANLGIVLAAVDHRYASVVYLGAGVRARDLTVTAAASRVNFAPRVSEPKLLLQGRYDEASPLRTEGQPLFDLFPEPKKQVIFEGGHIPPVEVAIQTVNEWLDETLGPVKQ
jgi:formylglycine-generating enzyme required for sulfatase activity